MSAVDLLDLLDLFRSAGADLWVDGGWAVDAALGRQTRPHADLDIVIEERHLGAAVRALSERGYGPVERDDTGRGISCSGTGTATKSTST